MHGLWRFNRCDGDGGDGNDTMQTDGGDAGDVIIHHGGDGDDKLDAFAAEGEDEEEEAQERGDVGQNVTGGTLGGINEAIPEEEGA